MVEPAPSTWMGFNVIGPVYESTGLGVAARGIIDSLLAHGYPVRFAAMGAPSSGTGNWSGSSLTGSIGRPT